MQGVSAVIDKDFASAKLAELVGADTLMILTAVDKVALNYGKPNEIKLDSLSTDEALKYCEEGHFAAGSMLPKVQAAIAFAQNGGSAIIASLEKAGDAVKGNAGTLIKNSVSK